MYFIASTPNGQSKFFDDLIRAGKIETAELLSIEQQNEAVQFNWSIGILPPAEFIEFPNILYLIERNFRPLSHLRGQSKRAKRRAELRKGGAA